MEQPRESVEACLDLLEEYLDERYGVCGGIPVPRLGTEGDPIRFRSLLGVIGGLPDPSITLGDLTEIFGRRCPKGGIPGKTYAKAVLAEGEELDLWVLLEDSELLPDEEVRVLMSPTLGDGISLVAILPDHVEKIRSKLRWVHDQIRKMVGIQRESIGLVQDLVSAIASGKTEKQ